jgi:hypothetical protein
MKKEFQMPVIGRRERLLPGKEILEAWFMMGSLARVSRHFQKMGRINDRTGQPFSQNAYWRSVSIYIIENPEEAREIYAKAEYTFSDEQWELYVLRRAMQVHKTSRTTFIRWVLEKKWPRKYEHLYQEHFGIEAKDYDYFEQLERRMPMGPGRLREQPLGRRPKKKNSGPVPG